MELDLHQQKALDVFAHDLMSQLTDMAIVSSPAVALDAQKVALTRMGARADRYAKKLEVYRG